MSKIDDVLANRGEVSAEDKLPEGKGNWLEALIEKQQAYHDSIQPVEVEVVLGESTATLLVPFIHPEKFTDLSDRHPPRPGVAADMSLWFNISGVTRDYPGIVLVTEDGDDDLFRLRDKSAEYVWPELYVLLSPEDAQNVRMAVWALHVWEPQQRLKAARTKSEGANHG